VATTGVLPLFPGTPRYPKLGAYPKYDDFTLHIFWGRNFDVELHWASKILEFYFSENLVF
jgi:hypothetical protein